MERTYKLMKRAGVAGITIGIIMIIVGVSTGIVAIVSGSRLIVGKNNIEF